MAGVPICNRALSHPFATSVDAFIMAASSTLSGSDLRGPSFPRSMPAAFAAASSRSVQISSRNSRRSPFVSPRRAARANSAPCSRRSAIRLWRNSFVPTAIEAVRPRPLQMLHPRAQIRGRRFHGQVKVVPHHDKRMHPPLESDASLSETPLNRLRRAPAAENRLPVVPAVDPKLTRLRLFDPELPRHLPKVPPGALLSRVDPVGLPLPAMRVAVSVQPATKIGLSRVGPTGRVGDMRAGG